MKEGIPGKEEALARKKMLASRETLTREETLGTKSACRERDEGGADEQEKPMSKKG